MDNIGDLLIQWFDEDKLRACIQLKSKCISYLGIISHNRLIKKDERKTNECCLENYKHTQTNTNTHTHTHTSTNTNTCHTHILHKHTYIHTHTHVLTWHTQTDTLMHTPTLAVHTHS